MTAYISTDSAPRHLRPLPVQPNGSGTETRRQERSVRLAGNDDIDIGGQSPWQYEAIYINRSKMVVKAQGLALSSEMAEMSYEVDYYFHCTNKDDAVALVTHMPIADHLISADQVNTYATPVVEQAINQVVQVTPLERVNEKIHDITEMVHSHLQDFLKVFGITLDMVKVLIFPRDERMRALISLKAFGLSEIDAVRYYTAMLMAERGIVSAPNMAVGEPFHIGSGVQMQVPQATLQTGAKNA